MDLEQVLDDIFYNKNSLEKIVEGFDENTRN